MRCEVAPLPNPAVEGKSQKPVACGTKMEHTVFTARTRNDARGYGLAFLILL
jgi:hypothetical protein